MNLVRSWPQGQAGPTPLGWRLPQPLMPPRVNGWPMGVVPSSDAEALLESAVAYWDASRYRTGDRFLRNQGVAGQLLDLRLGSSTVANTNDPLWLGPEQSGYVYVPGVTGNGLTVSTFADVELTGDLDLRARVLPDTFSAVAGVIDKITGFNGYSLRTDSAGRLAFVWGTGSAFVTETSTAAVSGTPPWVRVAVDVDNSGVYNVLFYTSQDGSSWTQLGTTKVGVTVMTIGKSTGNVTIGNTVALNTTFSGRVYRAQVLSGIDGTTVLDVDCDAITSGSATSFTATTGQTVTINRSSSGRKSVAQPARGKGGRACFLLGTDDYFEVPSDRVWQHQLLNFAQGDSFTVVWVGRHWPTVDSTNGVRVAWKGLTNSGARWGSLVSTTGLAVTALNDGTNSGSITGASISTGLLATVAGIVNRGAKITTTYASTSSSTSGSSSAIGSVANTNQFRIGATAEGAFASFEFTAAAIFRRALTASEISTLNTYFGGN